jgi:hypothetical protein
MLLADGEDQCGRWAGTRFRDDRNHELNHLERQPEPSCDGGRKIHREGELDRNLGLSGTTATRTPIPLILRCTDCLKNLAGPVREAAFLSILAMLLAAQPRPNMLSAADFGMVCDGASDAAPGWQRAQNAVRPGGASVVLLPRGLCWLASPVVAII